MTATTANGSLTSANSTTWAVHSTGDPTAEDGILLLPGAFCTAAFYDDVVTDPRVATDERRWVTATPPGFGGRALPAGFSPTIEGYAELTAGLAAAQRCSTIVGHSIFADVALELAASTRGEGVGAPTRVVLLSPCFRYENEEADLKMFNRLAKVPILGRGVWRLVRKIAPMAMKSRFPVERQKALLAEMQKADPRVTRLLFRHYFNYLAQNGSTLVDRLCESGVPAWVVRGEDDEIGLSDEDRARLEACPTVELVTVAEARHFVLTDQPAAVVDVILDATKATA